MASVYKCGNLFHYVFQPPNIALEPHDPTPLFVQLEVTITLELDFSRHYCSIDRFTYPNTKPFFFQETLRFDLHIVKDYHRVTQILGSMLTRLGINPCSLVFDNVLGELIEHGLRLSNCTSSMGRIVLPLHAELWGILVEHVDEEVSITRALAESKSKFETSGSGEGVIGLEDARVEGGDQCDQEGEESIKIKGDSMRLSGISVMRFQLLNVSCWRVCWLDFTLLNAAVYSFLCRPKVFSVDVLSLYVVQGFYEGLVVMGCSRGGFRTYGGCILGTGFDPRCNQNVFFWLESSYADQALDGVLSFLSRFCTATVIDVLL
ncbi:Uncharacterized protein TCM_011066 [Theobroma cacao]|uniref:Uncharacterized protein n=1 Tax=Theobroma cacao TaxID=3641 RepID=A0A061E9S5_THECC|nr:Uncharacterized protein TCM_011066 [Theobroma cacao]